MIRRVLIADDDALARTALRTIIDAHDDIELVAEAEDGLQAVEHTARLHPDVVLLDIRMPNLDGLQAARQILASASNRAQVIMLTTFDLDEYVYDALKAGATGFLRKDAPPERLLAFVRSAGEGEALLDPKITRRLVERYARRVPDQQALRAHPARAGSAHPSRRRPQQRRDRRRHVPQRSHRKNPRQPDTRKTRPTRPRPSGRARLRGRAGPTRGDRRVSPLVSTDPYHPGEAHVTVALAHDLGPARWRSSPPQSRHAAARHDAPEQSSALIKCNDSGR